jgi:hypothetical protein
MVKQKPWKVNDTFHHTKLSETPLTPKQHNNYQFKQWEFLWIALSPVASRDEPGRVSRGNMDLCWLVKLNYLVVCWPPCWSLWSIWGKFPDCIRLSVLFHMPCGPIPFKGWTRETGDFQSSTAKLGCAEVGISRRYLLHCLIPFSQQWSGASTTRVCVKLFYKSNDCAESARQVFDVTLIWSPWSFAVRQLMLLKPGSVVLKKQVQVSKNPAGVTRSVRTPATIAVVRDAFTWSPNRSARRRAMSLNLSRTGLRRILFNDL